MSRNKDLAEIFHRLSVLLEIQGESIFRIRAYQKAAEVFSQLTENVDTLLKENRLDNIPGIGAAIHAKTMEYLKTGTIAAYETVKAAVPESLLELTEVPSLGPKKIKLFFDELGIKSLDDLTRALDDGTIAGLPGIKEPTVEKIRQGIKVVRQAQGVMNMSAARQEAMKFLVPLKAAGVAEIIEVAGSLRRGKELVGDIDLLAVTDDPGPLMRTFAELPCARTVNASGLSRSSLMSDSGVQLDLRAVPHTEYGAALLYFTGSREFNIWLRQLAHQKGLKVSEYGIFRLTASGEERIAGQTEAECFRALGLPEIPPELREAPGFEKFFKGVAIPNLLALKDIQGEFHTHSTWSDGKNTVREMALAARARGYQYLALSDHSQSLRVANGVSPQDLQRKRIEIDALNREFEGFTILCGSEVEIDKDGGLDYNEAILKSLDVVVAAVHTHFDLSRAAQTQRLIRAIQHPRVHILAHPFARHIGKREPCDIDFPEVCRAAVDHGVCLEINASPVRLDLDSVAVDFAKKIGVRFVVSTDAHHVDHFDHLVNGVTIARRGGLEPGDVLNTFSLAEVHRCLAK